MTVNFLCLQKSFVTPAIALECARNLTCDMAELATTALKSSIECLSGFDKAKAKYVREIEDKTDRLEDTIGTYLIKLSTKQLNENEGAMASMLLKAIGDFERICDHAVNLVESSEEMKEKRIVVSESANNELVVLCEAVSQILDLTYDAFVKEDLQKAKLVEPLEQIIDRMKEQLRMHHILRMQQGACSIEAGFVWSDLLTNLERTSDHCSNVAGCILDVRQHRMSLHESLREMKSQSQFFEQTYAQYAKQYLSKI